MSETDIPYDLLFCDNCNCSNERHLQEISNFYNTIIQFLQKAVEDCVPNIKSHCSQQIPGWNEHVKDSHSIVRDAFHLWLIIGKPRQGAFYNHMKKPKLKNLLMNSSEQECASLWKSVKKLNRNRLPPVNSVDNISDEGAIAEVWREHYESILSCIDQSKYKNKVTSTLCNTKFDRSNGMQVSVAEVADAINNLKRVNPLGRGWINL